MTGPGYPKGSGQPVAPPNAPRARQLGVGVQPGTPNVIRALQVIISGANDFLLLYDGPPGVGTLLGSIAPPGTGSDIYGNPVVGGGFASYDAADSNEARLIFYGPKAISIRTGDASESAHAILEDEINGSGNAKTLNVTLKSAATTTKPDTVEVDLNSNNVGGTGTAEGELIYTDTGGTDHTYLTWGPGGAVIAAGSMAAVAPGTGTLATPATPAGWQTVSSGFLTGWSGTFQYKLLPFNAVAVRALFSLSGATVADDSTVLSLANSAYWPSDLQTLPAGCDGIKSGFNQGEMSQLRINSGGNVLCYGIGTAATYVQVTGLYYLDS